MKKLLCALPLALLLAGPAAGAEGAPRDNFYWLGQINKASDVINTQQGLLTPEQGRRFAGGIAKVLQAGEAKGAARPGLVITFEPLLIEAAGAEITMLHAGRSSQDMLTTVSIMRQREDVLQLAAALNLLHQSLLELAEQQRQTVLPNYTNGVAAQPNSYAHYLLAYADAYERDLQRLRQYYARLNRSPMGATVLNGTGWPLDRDKMADYLGFDGIAYNTYDAGQIFPMEAPLEMGGLAGSIAVHTTSFIEEIMQQYAQPRPWILLREGGGNTYVSSAMPQKRNPGILNKARTDCSTLLGLATGAAFRAHNIPAGMADGRLRGGDEMTRLAADVVRQLDRILHALEIKPERALEELNLDWTCSQEIADVLMRKYGVPFRTGHHFASEIVTYARTHNVPPSAFTYGEARQLYASLAAQDASLPPELPMTEADFLAALDPRAIVNSRAVKGGPQPAELDVMLRSSRRKLAQNCRWLQQAQQRLQQAEERLNSDFDKLLS